MSWHIRTIHRVDNGSLGGLLWNGTRLLFSAVEASVIYAFDPTEDQVVVWRAYTNRSNAIAEDGRGAVFAGQEGARRVVRLLPDGSAVQTETRLEGQLHNFPRHIAVDRAGSAWFSDCYHPQPASGPQIFPLLTHQSVLRLSSNDSKRWTLARMTVDTSAPRGLAFSPTKDRLYLAEVDMAQSVSRLYAYTLADDKPVQKIHLADINGVAEGICVDDDNRAYVCVGGKAEGECGTIQVFACDGVSLSVHELPVRTPFACALGDADMKSLYITSAEGVLLRARASA